MTLHISRPAQDQAGEKTTISIRAFDDSDEAGERGLIADVPPADVRQAIIGLSPQLFRFLCDHFGDDA